jgi:hypothetical protein
MTGIDDVAVATTQFGRNDRRLDDADSLDRRQHQRIGLGRRFGLAHPVWVFPQSARVDLNDVHGIFTFGRFASWRLAGPSYLQICKDTSRPAGRPDCRNGCRASLPGRTSGASALRRRNGRDRAGGG